MENLKDVTLVGWGYGGIAFNGALGRIHPKCVRGPSLRGKVREERHRRWPRLGLLILAGKRADVKSERTHARLDE